MKLVGRKGMLFRFGSRGFTLVELAMVLVVIGILVSLGMGLIGPLTKTAKYNETKDIVTASVESVISFSAASKRLPTSTEFPTKVRNPNDAWTKPLYYFPDPSLTSIPAGSTDAICGRSITSLTICQDAACTVATNIPNAAFVVVSGADNYNIQTGTSIGGTCPPGQTCVRVYPIDTLNVDDNATDFTRLEPYDDIVKWVTLDELRTKVGCVGAQLKIQNAQLPSGYRCGAYSATLFAQGGIPFPSGGSYKWCTQGTLPGGLTLTPNVTSANCLSLAEASWGQANNLTLAANTGALFQRGTFSLTVFVRDNNDLSGSNDNIAQQPLFLTITESGNNVRIWNAAGATFDFLIGGFCRNNVTNNAEISDFTAGRFLVPGATVNRYSSAGTCNTFLNQSITYDQAINGDANCNYQVNFTLSGVTDR